MSTAYIFPGQGSQALGMGAELFPQFPELVAAADAILGYSIAELCIEGPKERLDQTQFTQPALYVVSALQYLADKEQDDFAKPSVLAGHSLGEYSALFAAGVFDFATGLRLVQKRGALMSQVEGGGMAAVLGMSREGIENLVKDKNLDAIDVANFNTPVQTVLSGMKSDIEAAADVFTEAGARRYVTLAVSGAFHSRYMRESQVEFTKFAADFEFKAAETPVIANVTAQAYGAEIIDTLSQQISSSVRWVESVQLMKAEYDVETFVECGPGKVLTGMVRKI